MDVKMMMMMMILWCISFNYINTGLTGSFVSSIQVDLFLFCSLFEFKR